MCRWAAADKSAAGGDRRISGSFPPPEPDEKCQFAGLFLPRSLWANLTPHSLRRVTGRLLRLLPADLEARVYRGGNQPGARRPLRTPAISVRVKSSPT